MKILVTGALGHIGSSIIREIPASFVDVEIIMLDNMRTQRYCSLFNLPKGVKYKFIQDDIRTIDLYSLLKNVDIVIHLAAITDASNSFEIADEIEDNNFNATKRIAGQCAELGVKLIVISSTSVYGTQSSLVDESCGEGSLNPQSPYATVKLKEEKLVQQLVRQKGLKAVICRFGTIFGPSSGMRFHTAVNKFCWQAVLGHPLSIWETAFDQKRPYLDLSDACRAIIHIIKKELFNGELYNVLTVNATVRDIVSVIKETIPRVNLAFINSPIMNQLSYEVSSQKFQSTGFIPEGSLQLTIEKEIKMLINANRD
jgi:UDP-glucose 4-epimerase